MCINKKTIKTSTGKSIVVKCGHCPACLQEKANFRAAKIINNRSNGDGFVTLFLTLTYRNDCAPYILRDELFNSEPFEMLCDDHGFKKGDRVRLINIYRDSKIPNSRSALVSTPYRRIDEAIVYNMFSEQKFKPMQNCSDSRKISVCYYKDAQDFIKRLRQNIKRDGHNFKISFYMCSEMGPTTCRAHFHGLIDVPCSFVEYTKTAIAKAWPYADYRRTYDNIKVSKKAASYVASYVNCSTTVPLLFTTSNYLRPRHSTSQGYGLAKEYLSLRAIIKYYRRRDFRISLLTIRKGVSVIDTCLVPKYALCRYFSKIKGFSRLTSDEIVSICLRPRTLASYARKLNYEGDKDVHANMRRLGNMKLRFIKECPYDMTLSDKEFLWCQMYASIWTIYNSNVLGMFYSEIHQPSDNFVAYDNIIDFFSATCDNLSLSEVLFQVPASFHFESDPNNFPKNIARHTVLTEQYKILSKDRKVRNLIYSDLYHDC